MDELNLNPELDEVMKGEVVVHMLKIAEDKIRTILRDNVVQFPTERWVND